MRRLNKMTNRAIWVAVILLLLGGGRVLAQAPPEESEAVDAKLARLWDDFLHYILIARPDVAESHAKSILAAKPDPRQLYRLSVQATDCEKTLARGRRNEKLAELIDKIKAVIDQGALELRRDPAEIRRWIQALAGHGRAFINAQKRLIDCGEYAVPQMVAALAAEDTPDLLRERVVVVLPRLGKDAVRPLVEVLASSDPKVQEVAARTLGKIGYPHACAALKELAQREGVLKPVQEAALLGLDACGGEQAAKKPVAELFYDLAEKYYRREESINPDPRYDAANVWYWAEGLGVTYKPVPRVIFNDIYAMVSARKALTHDESFYSAVVLWLAAKLRAEVDLPQGATNPFQPADKPGADFYCLASGPKYLQMVLHRALADGDVKVAVRAIGALAGTAPAENLFAGIDQRGGAQPLVEALSYPVRIVRYMAADALAKARPDKRFTGSDLVAAVLVEALRQTGTPTVVLADPDVERRNKTKDLLRALGYEVADGDGLGDPLAKARKGGGVDLFVLASGISTPGIGEALASLRSEGIFSRTPAVVIAKSGDVLAVRGQAKSHPALEIILDSDLDKSKLDAAIATAKSKAAGGAELSADEAAEWAIRAAGCFKLLAETNNPVYDLTTASGSLIAALTDQRDPVRIAAAQALAQFRGADVQPALAALADDAKATKQVRLVAYAALAESLRLFGKQLDETQIDAVIAAVTGQGDLELRDAAARVLGAMNLPSEKIKELILTAP